MARAFLRFQAAGDQARIKPICLKDFNGHKFCIAGTESSIGWTRGTKITMCGQGPIEAPAVAAMTESVSTPMDQVQ